MAEGPLIILSGPSGSGKSTVINRLLVWGELPLRLSVSATTRPPRLGEQDGVNYHFWSREQFEAELRANAFLEWAEVFGRYYGTLKREVEPFRHEGIGVILDIDVQGAAQVRRQCPEHLSFFLRTSSPEVYERRLRQRGTEGEAEIQKRLAAAQRELACAGDYQYQIINDDLERAVAELKALLERHWTRDHHAG
jgi:guanylate kinase